MQLSGAVKGSLGPSVLVPVFFRVGLEEVEGNVGQNSLLTSISCHWGAQGSCGGEGGPVDITPQQSRSVWMDGTNGLHP